MSEMDVAAAPLQVSENAARKVRQLMEQEGRDGLMLRVYVTGGGCAGFQYGFRFEENAAEDDVRIERDGVVVLVDPMSLQYLGGAEIDYVENLQGAQFVIRNPNASATCGCGSSFTV